MLIHKNKAKKTAGKGLINSIINKLPFEAHLPGYKFCGPGTNLTKRLARGDTGINALDEACKEHDIAYDREKDLPKRHEADRQLLKLAEKRLHSGDSSIGEKAAALGVTAAMKTKLKFGMGCCSAKKRKSKVKSRKLKKRKTGGLLSVGNVIKGVRTALRNVKGKNLMDSVKIAMKAVNKVKRKKGVKAVRVIPVPKKGGFLPLIPIFAGLSALGALTGGAAGVAKAVTDAKAARDQLAESNRHNKAMEGIAVGKGFYMKPYKEGLGLFLMPGKSPKNYP